MPTTTFCCGGECGITAAGAAPGTGVLRHWDSFNSALAPTVVAGLRGRGRALKFDPSGTAKYAVKNTASSPTAVVIRGVFRFDSLLNIDGSIALYHTASGSNFCQLFFRQATSDVIPRVGSTNGSTAYSIVAGQVYIVTMTCDVSTTTYTCSVQIKKLGESSYTDLGTATKTGIAAATTIDSLRFGAGTGGEAVTGTVVWDDMVVSQTAGDYPFADGMGFGLQMRADGTHSFNLNTDFKVKNTTNIETTATDTWTHVARGDCMDVTDYLSVSGAASGEYLEWLVAYLPYIVASINGLEAVAACLAEGTAADKQTLRMVDGGSTSDVLSDADQSQTTVTHGSKHYNTKPSGGAWTVAALNALKFRWTSSFGTVDETPVPDLAGLMLEVDCAFPISEPPSIVAPDQDSPFGVVGQAVSRAAYW